MNSIMEQIRTIGIVPVVVLDRAEDAPFLGKILCEGGLPCAEITFRTEAAAEAIRLLATECPKLLVGAGTVLNTAQAESALAAGAKFIVTPGLLPDVIRYCQEKDLPVVPGVQTATEIAHAAELGISTVKFFPAEPAGGLAMIRALAAPFPGISFLPTGGIHAGNVGKYLSYNRIAACGGSWMVKKELIAERNGAELQRLIEEAAQCVREVRGGQACQN